MTISQLSRRSTLRDETPVEIQNDDNFGIQRFKGSIAQGIIELIFRDAGYDVYPYGYENHVFNNIKHMRKKKADTSTKKLRTSPDFFVYDRSEDEGYFLEVKFTRASDEHSFLIKKNSLDNYKAHWNEAFLVVYCAGTGNIYCRQFQEIDLSKLDSSGFKQCHNTHYVLNLADDFEPLPTHFTSINGEKLDQLMKRVNKVFKQLLPVL